MKTKKVNFLWYGLLLVPIFGCLWVPFYNFREPTFLGFPFFYWYQLLWTGLTSLFVFIVYKMTKPRNSKNQGN